MSSLNQSMRPVASFLFASSETAVTKKLCLFSGHYDTSEIVPDGSGQFSLGYGNPASIRNAGYDCDQVADDFLYTGGKNNLGERYPIVITPKSRVRFRDFMNYIRLANLRVTKMRITDLAANSDHAIFNQEIEVSKSMIGSKAGSDFIQLSAHIDPSNFLQNFIEVDLEKQNLVLDETTLAFLDIPAGAKFQIDFTLAE